MKTAKAPKRLAATTFDLYAWMQDVITHPDGVGAAVQASTKKRTHALSGRKPHEVVRRSRNLTSKQRIDIYADMYKWRLIECVAQDFPYLQRTIGDEKFEQLSRDYIASHPSTHYNLAQLTRHMSAFLRGPKCRLPKKIFLSELAALERAIEEVFDAEPAAGKIGDLMSYPPADWGRLKLTLAPTVRVLGGKYPFNDYLQALKEDKTVGIPPRQDSYVVVYREGYDVWRLEITQPQFLLLSAFGKGLTMTAAVEHCLRKSNESAETIIASIPEWFKMWTSRGFFSNAELAPVD